MRSEYKKNILDAYQKKKNDGKISINLSGHSPAQLRDECINVYKERPLKEDEEILRAFFGSKRNESSYVEIIESIDIDKFKPVRNFIIGRTTNPEIRVIEILAWLIDFKPRPYPIWLTERGTKPTSITTGTILPFIISKPVFITLTFIFLGLGSFLYNNYRLNKLYTPAETAEKCMYWTGHRYEPIACDAQTSNSSIIEINFQKLNRFKKISLPDKLTKSDLGKVWYTKIHGEVEFYTDSGTHPLDTNRVLKPLTDYILKTHTSYDKYLLYCFIGGIGAILLIVVSFISFKRYSKI